MKHRGPFVCVWYGRRGTCCEARPIFQGDWLKLLGWEPPRSVRRLSSRARPVSWMTERAAGLLWLPARRCRRPRLVVASLASAGEGNSPARSKASFIACICTVDSNQAPCYVNPDPWKLVCSSSSSCFKAGSSGSDLRPVHVRTTQTSF